MSNRIQSGSLVKRADVRCKPTIETEDERELRIYGDPRFISNKVDRHVCSQRN
jgi:hypothetical protein